PYFLYKNEQYDPEDPVKGLFKNVMLMQAFKHVFTSPSSVDSENVVSETDQEDCKPPLKCQKGSNEKCNQSHVAALLGMKSVSPHVIAYIAVQLCFALSICNCWCIINEDFDYQKFYSNIILFLEGVCTMQEKKEISNLLFWWNWCVFLFYL
ncbi:hypothetical protein SCLCIDRAFT_116469, partial [Scleroderma citrinum Foug A]